MSSHLTEPSASPLRHRFEAPGVPRGSIERPRLDRLLTELFDTYSIVEIVAAPGSGKTVEAQLYARACGRLSMPSTAVTTPDGRFTVLMPHGN